jgi:F420-0:gamma-glutamyl ligase
MQFEPNQGKSLTITTDFGEYARYPVKTHVIMREDVLEDVLDKYVREHLQEGDTLFIAEKIVAITQGGLHVSFANSCTSPITA